VLESFHESSVNRSKQYYFNISGKGINVSRVLVELGEPVMHLTQLGGFFRDFFLQKAREERIPLKYARSPGEIRFGITVCNQEHSSGTEILEEGDPVDSATEKTIIKLYSRMLLKTHTVIISGKKASGYSDDVFPSMVKSAKLSGKTVICDFRGKDLAESIQYKPDIIKLNIMEFTDTFFNKKKMNRPIENQINAVLEKMQELYMQHQISCVITDGPNIIRYNGKDGHGEFIPRKIKPLNPIGSGDAFAAGMASQFYKSGNLTESVAMGEECARKNALNYRPGTIT